jgi:hypothetical protein
VYNQLRSSPTIRNSYLKGGTVGLFNDSSETKIQNSEIRGGITLVTGSLGESKAYVAHTLLKGSVSTGDNTLKCVGVYKKGFNEHNCHDSKSIG